MLLRVRSFTALLAVFLIILTLAPVRAAVADAQPLTNDEAIALLRTYGIVKGDPDGSLSLKRPLTRAEAATIFVRSLGMERDAANLAASVPFSDARGHWGAGAIAMAERLGLMRGDGDGTFRPNADITYAEVLTVLLRMVNREPAGPWQVANITAAASQLGIVPTGIQVTDSAVRGKIFWSLAVAVSRVPLASGKTVLQMYIDSTPPSLVLDRPSLTTMDATAVVSGTATDAVRVTVGGNPAVLSNGRFSYNANLSWGQNSFLVEATDAAGNKASAAATVERRGNISRIEITGPTMVRVSTSAHLAVTAFNAQGQSIPTDGLQVSVSGVSATFDLATGNLTAGNSTGHGVLTLQTGNVSKTFPFDVTDLSPRAAKLAIMTPVGSPTIGKEAIVKVQVLDANGNLATDDYWRTVSLSAAGLAGMSIQPAVATTQAGVATFAIKGSVEGTARLTATTQNLDPVADQIQIATATRVVLSATPATLMPDGTSVANIRASLQDENGTAVRNSTASDIVVSLTVTGSDGVLTTPTVTIPRNASNSYGYDAAFRASVRPDTATITGTIVSDQRYSVQSLTLPVNAKLPAVTLQVVAPTIRQAPGSTVAVTVRVLGAQNQLIQTGSYAFQLKVTTSNNETVTAGLPQGVDLSFPGSVYRPVADGRPVTDPLNDTNAVVGRTYQGTATLALRYDKSGVVTVTPVLVNGALDGYHGTVGFGPAASTAALIGQATQVTFAGTPAKINLTVDSILGRDQAGGAVSTASSMIIRAQVVDSNNVTIPSYSDYITLTRSTSGSGATHLAGTTTGTLRKAAINGVAEFTVQAAGIAGYDVYTASAASLPLSGVEVAVRTEKAGTPTIAAIRGVKNGDPSPDTGYVAPDADYMDIQLHPQLPPNANDPNYWVTAKVYRKGESTPLFTSGVIDLKSDLPVIHVPKSALRPGQFTYEVVINNGVGDTGRSPDLGLSSSLNAVFNANYRITSAFFSSPSNRLTLFTSSLVSGGSVDPSQIVIVKDNHSLNLADNGTSVISVGPSQVVLQLTNAPDPDTYNGTVNVQAQAGWFVSPDRTFVAQTSPNVLLKPMAVIKSATLDVPNKRLYLNGVGFTQGTLALELIKILQGNGTPVALRPGQTTTTDRVVATTDAQVTIALSQTTLDAINDLGGPDTMVAADAGWLKTTSGSSLFSAQAITNPAHRLYVRAAVTSVLYDRTSNTLTIRGTGFSGATVDPTRLVFRATGTTRDWSTSAGTVARVTDDTTLVVTLSDTEAAAFESTTWFGGRTVFMNTDTGWLVDQQQRPAAPVPTNSVLFAVPAR